MTRMPALFIGHGSPMNTLEENSYTRVWREIGAHIPKPRAILAVSAHWYFGATAVTAMPQPRTIHDFYGFPAELFAFDYPAPGAPDVAVEVVEAAKPLWVGLDQEQWGLDHGTWSVLAHMFPAADVPVLQLSLSALKPLDYHLDMARRVSALRDRGILILASGNVVHNLGRIDWSLEDAGFDWARRFDDAVHDKMIRNPADILAVTKHPDYALAMPTPEHFLPLLYVAGAASADEPARALMRGYAMGSLSMTCYGVGYGAETKTGDDAAPLPSGVPADDTNT